MTDRPDIATGGADRSENRVLNFSLAHVIDSWGNWRASDSALVVLQDYFLRNVSKADNSAEMKIGMASLDKATQWIQFRGGIPSKVGVKGGCRRGGDGCNGDGCNIEWAQRLRTRKSAVQTTHGIEDGRVIEPRSKPDRATQQARFEAALASAMAGEGVSVHAGVDNRTFRALGRLTGRSPNPPSELIDAAYEAFAGQLDGSNARAEDTKLPWFMREGDETNLP